MVLKTGSKERKRQKNEVFSQRLEQAKTHALKAKAAIGKKKAKRKALSKAFQDFSEFSATLEGAGSSPSARARAAGRPGKASVAKERERLSAVVSHPQFQVNPLKAVQNHLRHTLMGGDAVAGGGASNGAGPSAGGKKNKKKKRVTEAERRQQRYRKKMDKEAAMYMDDA
eukprot:CAMPEP_0198470098 /NCGR_PEP_ID=MMETSP1456-20131121/15990_1 /TAXON_ID=1461544 ORGANISM="Unidentified sp., Strain RCC1871" /NCGR_SAMPLE_ID=MMETSP1456 /ASSEMBLY_ACC=CAM_ASM_001119 /LENGTH=169 /DNA_ID=CAMNT_0044196569 /DNA_START=11 /DNA_END=520 /DNA_ORIENTATION=-